MGLIVSSLLAVALAVAAPPREAAPLTSPFNLLVEPRGTVLVADGASGRIVRVDPRTGRRSVYARRLGHAYALAYGPGGLYATTTHQVVRFRGAARQVVASGFGDPLGLAVARDGTAYVVDSTKNRVVKVAPTGKQSILVSSGLDQPIGAALTSDGSLLVTDSHHGRVVKVEKDGRLTPVLRGLALPVGVTAAGRAVYVVDHVRHDARGKILRLRPGGRATPVSAGKIKAVASVATGPGGVLYATSFLPPFVGRVAADGTLVPFQTESAPAARIVSPIRVEPDGADTLLVADTREGRVFRLQVRTGKVTPVGPGLTRLAAIARAPDRTLFALADEKLWRLDGTSARLVASFDTEGPTDLAPRADGSVYVARYGAHVDLVSPDGTVSVVARGFDRPHGITLAGDGSLLVADSYAGAVRRVTPDGRVTTIATGLATPTDVVVAGDGGLVVAEHGGGRVARIGPDGSVAAVATGLRGPAGLAFLGGVLYVADLEGGAVFAVASNGRLRRVSR